MILSLRDESNDDAQIYLKFFFSIFGCKGGPLVKKGENFDFRFLTNFEETIGQHSIRLDEIRSKVKSRLNIWGCQKILFFGTTIYIP